MSEKKRRQPGDVSSAAWLESVLAVILEVLQAEQKTPVSRPISSADMRSVFDFSLPEDGGSLEEVMKDLGEIARLSPRTASNRFFNQLYGGRDVAAAAAEMLSAIVNTSMYTHKIAGINADIEEELTTTLASMAGFPNGEGCICPGGSISNLLSMVLARDAWVKKHGPATAPLTVYTSELCHYSIRKNAGLTGLGRDHVRKVPCDGRGRLDPSALSRMLHADRQRGFLPFMISATSGTTVLGAFDPLDELGALAQAEGLWLHVDGALGGAMLFSNRHRGLLKGLELADSFSWNAHKMMGTPLSCSLLMVKEKGTLRDSLEEDADYLFQSDDTSMDLGLKSIQCGRRNDALKLWAAWRHHGSNGFKERVDHLMEMAQSAARMIDDRDELVLIAPPESVNVCFRHVQAPASWLCRRLELEQRALVSHALVRGEEVIRLPFVNPALTEDDVMRLLDDIADVAAGHSS